MKMNDFLLQHAVFTLDELDRFLAAEGSGNPNTRKALLTYYRKQGRILSVRRGLYATVPPGMDAKTYPVDPYLVAAKMAPDAVLAYHTALAFHGKAHTLHNLYHYASSKKSLPVEFQSHKFLRAPVPPILKAKSKEMFDVISRRHSGVEIRVTNLERTFVDVLDRPGLTGAWEEIWRSLESIEFFNVDQVVAYVLLLENATTAAKVGFFLEQHKENLMIDESHLDPLRRLRPQQPHYFIRGKRKNCRLVKDWNLMIPEEILNRSWEEVL